MHNDLVPIVSRVIIDQEKVRKAVGRAERKLKPDVVRVLFSFADDVQGNTALFFRVVLSDQAAALSRLRDTTQRVTSTILNAVNADELGLQTYFNFRSLSEQAMMKEPKWER